MRHIHPKTPLLLILLMVIGLLATGCSDDNPAAPAIPGGNDDGGEEEVRVPRSLKITKIGVSSFGEKNGGVWDATLSVSGRRPDLYVTLRTGTSVSAPNYVSNVIDDAFSGAPYDFTASSAGTGLPKTFAGNRAIYLHLMDEDIGNDDTIGSVSFKPLDSYRNDNAAGFYKVFFGTNSTKVSVTGTWVY
jgi:hypothetical protein